MLHRAFRLAYDGTSYRGFQRQPHGETVEDVLFDALAALDVQFEDDTPPGYAAAGRTDAGVSARAQTVAFEAPEWLTPRALNGELPAEVRAWAQADVPDSFHATRDATLRWYRYFLHGSGVDTDRAESVCERLSGRHDFHNVTPDDTGTVRDVSMTARPDGEFLVVDVHAGGFARQLVRRLVTVLDEIATGRRDAALVGRVLDDEPLVGPEGIAPAPPEPLVLFDVAYPDVEFVVDETAVESARAVFERRRLERAAGARVADALVPPRTEGGMEHPRAADDDG